MSIDAEKWDNDIEYAYEKMIEREKEKEYRLSQIKYEKSIPLTNAVVTWRYYQ